MAHRLRLNSNLLVLVAIALLGAMLLPPDALGFLRATASAVFFPISASVRAVAERVDNRVTEPRKSISQERAGDKSLEQLQNELETLKSQYAIVQANNVELQVRLNERRDWPADLLKHSEVAEVIGGDPGFQQALKLQPGTPRDPTEGAPVLAGLDIVGRLKVIGLSSSKVILLTDRTSAVRANVTRYRKDGSGMDPIPNLVFAPHGDGNGKLVVTGMKLADIQLPDGHFRIDVGDRVVLNDPVDWPTQLQGFTIGEIESVTAGTTPLFCDVVIRPRRDLMKLHEVMVWKK